jgi:hypothetical protein
MTVLTNRIQGRLSCEEGQCRFRIRLWERTPVRVDPDDDITGGKGSALDSERISSALSGDGSHGKLAVCRMSRSTVR